MAVTMPFSRADRVIQTGTRKERGKSNTGRRIITKSPHGAQRGHYPSGKILPEEEEEEEEARITR